MGKLKFILLSVLCLGLLTACPKDEKNSGDQVSLGLAEFHTLEIRLYEGAYPLAPDILPIPISGSWVIDLDLIDGVAKASSIRGEQTTSCELSDEGKVDLLELRKQRLVLNPQDPYEIACLAVVTNSYALIGDNNEVYLGSCVPKYIFEDSEAAWTLLLNITHDLQAQCAVPTAPPVPAEI